MTKGKLLVHVVSKEGINIDPKREKSIQSLSLPTSKANAHSLFGKFNFLRQFKPDFAEKNRHIVDMMKGKTIFC